MCFLILLIHDILELIPELDAICSTLPRLPGRLNACRLYFFLRRAIPDAQIKVSQFAVVNLDLSQYPLVPCSLEMPQIF